MKATYQTFEQRAALKYLHDQLAGGKTLSSFLLQTVQRSNGALSYMSPRPLSPEEAIEFETAHTFDFSSPQRVKIGNISGIYCPVPNTKLELVDSVKTRLVDADHFSFLENSLAAPSDPWLKRAKSRILVHRDEVYHLAAYSKSVSEDVLSAVSEASNAMSLVGMVGRIPNAIALLDPAQPLSLEELEVIARSAECIFVGAFDGEGYVIWEEKADDLG